MSNSLGVSEVVGAVLMITVVVVAVSLIMVMLFSHATPEELPNVNFMAGSDSSGNLYLSHNGGDRLTQGSFTVLVDSMQCDYSLSDGSTVWSLGKNLFIPSSSGCFDPGLSEHRIAIVYDNTGSGSVVLRSASVGTATMQGEINPDTNPTAARLVFPPVISTRLLMGNITNNSVYCCGKDKTMISGGTIKFNITKSDSVINYQIGGVHYPQLTLETGDVVEITPFVDPGDAFSVSDRMAGMGDQIWDMGAERADISITNRSGGDVSLDDVTLVDGWINGYKDMESTLIISLDPEEPIYTNLRVNRDLTFESPQMIPVYNNPIHKARPTTTGIFLLRYDNATKSMFFIGNGDVTI